MTPQFDLERDAVWENGAAPVRYQLA